MEREAFQALLEFERNAYYSDYATTGVGECAPSVPRSPTNPNFGWRADLPWLTSQELLSLQKQHSELIKAYAIAESTLARADRRVTAERNRFFSSSAYKAKFEEMQQRESRFNLGGSVRYQMTGASYLMKNLYPEWWDSFDAIVTSAVQKAIDRGALRIALRDPNVIGAIESREAAGQKWDNVAQEVFSDRGNDWGVPPASADAIRQMRARLRIEDRTTAEWIRRNGGAEHPCNIYFLWGQRHNIRVDSTRSRAGGIGREFRNIHEALNDLCWLLSSKEDVHLDTKPLTHEGYSKEDWEAHRKKWWAQIERAKNAARPK